MGFGELASELARGLREAGAAALHAYSRPRPDPVAAGALAERLAKAGAVGCRSLEEAVTGADIVFAAVPAAAGKEVAASAAPLLRRGALYVDTTTLAPAEKEAAAATVEGGGALYVDAAILGTVATSGYAVPFLVSGSGAPAFRDLVAPLAMNVTAIDAPAGHATLVKLLRSVYMKGRDALVAEMLLAARRHGLDAVVADSIAGPGEEVSFRELSERVLTALAVHAGRRADELATSSEVVDGAGVEPIVTRAGAERLRRIADLGLREAFHGERPADADQVLAALDRLAGRTSGA